MAWNHRVVKIDTPLGEYFGICEVYYNEEGEPWSRTKDFVSVGGEAVEGLRWTLEHMLKSLDQPVLTDADIKAKAPFEIPEELLEKAKEPSPDE